MIVIIFSSPHLHPTKKNIQKHTQIANKSFRLVKFLLDYFKRSNSMHTKSTKQKHSKGRKMLAAKICCTSVQRYTIRQRISTIAAPRMWYDISLARPLSCARHIRYSWAKVYRRIMGQFLRDNRWPSDNGICSHDIGSNACARPAKRIGPHLISSTTRHD